jgi:hypothetical protein
LTQTYEEFASALADLGAEFEGRVKEHVVSRVPAATLRLVRGDIVVAETAPGCFAPYGCPACLGVKPGQDVDGTPTVSGRRCINAAEQGVVTEYLPEVAAINMWFCPACKMPVHSLFPRFE